MNNLNFQEIEKLCEAISNCVSDQKQKTQLRSHTAKLIPNNSLSEGNVVKVLFSIEFGITSSIHISTKSLIFIS